MEEIELDLPKSLGTKNILDCLGYVRHIKCWVNRRKPNKLDTCKVYAEKKGEVMNHKETLEETLMNTHFIKLNLAP